MSLCRLLNNRIVRNTGLEKMPSGITGFIKLTGIRCIKNAGEYQNAAPSHRITTGLKLGEITDNFKFEFASQSISISPWQSIGGFESRYRSEDHEMIRVIRNDSGNSIGFCWHAKPNDRNWFITSIIDRTYMRGFIQYTLSKDKYSIWNTSENSYNMDTYPARGLEDPDADILFANTYGDEAIYKDVIIKYGRIYDGDILVREYIPMKRLSDGAVGFYETVTGEFKENEGFKEFIAVI